MTVAGITGVETIMARMTGGAGILAGVNGRAAFVRAGRVRKGGVRREIGLRETGPRETGRLAVGFRKEDRRAPVRLEVVPPEVVRRGAPLHGAGRRKTDLRGGPRRGVRRVIGHRVRFANGRKGLIATDGVHWYIRAVAQPG